VDFFITKDGGKFKNIKKMEDYNKSLPDGRYKVTIEAHSKRTLQQNAWFHAVLPDILQGLRDAGFNEVKNTEDAKDVVKALFFKKEITNGSETFQVIEGTSKQSKLNFAEKADEIIRWAAEYLNIDVAPPNEQLTIDV
jgi:hypothetical protein